MKRLSIDEYYLNIAKAVAARSTCLIRQYGAVIVNNDEIISTEYNGSPRGTPNCCDEGFCKRHSSNHSHNDGDYDSCESVHAEMSAMLSAAKTDFTFAPIIEIVTCKDCKHWHNDGIMTTCDKNIGNGFPQDYFCANAERRE